MGETALSSFPSKGHMSYSRAHKCCWLCPREASVWWPAFLAGLGAASLHQATDTSTRSYLCQPSTQTHGSGTLTGHTALPTALFPRKSLESFPVPRTCSPRNWSWLPGPAPTSGQRSRAWKHGGISLAPAQDLHHWEQSALSAFPASHKRTMMRSEEKDRRQGPPAFPATPLGSPHPEGIQAPL